MADFSELKAAIRADIKDNTEQEITGNVLQGDLLRMVDDINAAKVDKEEGKGLSANDFTDEDKNKVNSAIGDAPADGVQYGRVNHLWRPIQYAAGLTVTLAIPEGVNPALYTVVVRAYEDGTDERYAYYPGFAASIPAGKTILVNVIPPTGCTAPVSAVYNTQAGVSYAFAGTSERISDGVYIFDRFGAYTPWQLWNTARNDDAVGVGYRSYAMSFVMAKKWASATSPTNGSDLMREIYFGGNGDYLSDFGCEVALDENSALMMDGYFAKNNKALCDYHEASQPNWKTDATITNNSDVGYAPAAAACARFLACEGDEIGSWGLPQINVLKFAMDSMTGDFGAAYIKIKGSSDMPTVEWSCLPSGTTRGAYICNITSVISQMRNYRDINAKPFRPF